MVQWGVYGSHIVTLEGCGWIYFLFVLLELEPPPFSSTIQYIVPLQNILSKSKQTNENINILLNETLTEHLSNDGDGEKENI